MARTQIDFEVKRRRLRQRDLERLFYAGIDITIIDMLRGGAGSFPDVPSRRMAPDADGTVLYGHSETGAVVEQNQTVQTEMADEDDIDGINLGLNSAYWVGYIFPELREVDGVYGFHVQGIGKIDTSGDTTNGRDGTWTNRIANYVDSTTGVYSDYRDDIASLAVSNVRGLRYEKVGANAFAGLAFHPYGEISAGETPDRLLWFDQSAALEFALPIDYGDSARGMASDFVTYLKNNSGSLSAGTVQVTAEDLYLGSGAWFTFSEGGSYQATLSLASSIGSGANSPNITIRRIIPDAAQLGLHAARAYANVGAWT